ncbi:MAG TPA: type II toxin-antitoxin system CcdA family antitoxin [Pseudonocardiaceae bacterium]|nr:type II toxin-antitoxin system CcdA family antitoxin [Pseudonocardiaceae bacterium]
MAKQKVSVTLSPERLDRARAVTGTANLSELLELALDALVERELERRWLAAHEHETNDDLPGEVPIDLAEVPWQGR